MPQPPVYRFGDFLLDPAMRELRQVSGEVSLPPKSFDCLVYLIEHRDRAVGRDELISAVWGRADVSDAVLAQTLLRARRAVGDTGSEQTTVRTIPRFGYRWVAPLAVEAREPMQTGDAVAAVGVEAGGAAVLAPPAPAWPQGASRPRRPWGWIALAAGIAIAAMLAWYLPGAARKGDKPAVPGTALELVVVLPVAMAASDNPEQAWVRLGAMDYISSRLRGNGALNVLPSSQVLQLVDASGMKDADGVAQRLRAATNARFVVRPSAVASRNGWTVRLHVVTPAKEGGLDVEARGDTALAAAAAATDSLLRRLGRLKATRAPAPTALAERLQQIDAELLAGQLANARALVQGAAPALRGEPALLLREGQVEFRAGRIKIAAALFEGLLADAGAVPKDIRAQASMGLGASAIRAGDFPAAEKRYGNAVAMLERDDAADPTLLGNAYNGRGIARLELGNEAEAIADIGRARLAMQRAGNDLEVASVDTNLGMLESRRGNNTRAIQQFDRAIATFERFGVTDNLVAALQAKASAQMRMAQTAAALATIERAAGRIDRIENPLLRDRVTLVMAGIYIANGRLREAEDRLARLGDAPDPRVSAQVDKLRVRLLLNRGVDREAARLVQTIAGRNHADDETVLLGVQASLRVRDAASTKAWLDKAETGGRERAAWTLAQALAASGEPSAATAFAAAEAAALREGSPGARIDAGCAHAAYLIGIGDTDRASAILGEIGTLADNDYRIAHSTLGLYRKLGDQDGIRTSEAAVGRLAGQRDPALPLVY